MSDRTEAGGNITQVNSAAVNVGAGNASTGTQRVIIATDDPNLASINAGIGVPTSMVSGAKTVSTSGTAEALGTTLATKQIYIRAKTANTGEVYVGDSTVDASTNKGIILSAGDSLVLSISNRTTVYIDVAVNGEGVDYVALT